MCILDCPQASERISVVLRCLQFPNPSMAFGVVMDGDLIPPLSATHDYSFFLNL